MSGDIEIVSTNESDCPACGQTLPKKPRYHVGMNVRRVLPYHVIKAGTYFGIFRDANDARAWANLKNAEEDQP
jgi:hypothetical protein